MEFDAAALSAPDRYKLLIGSIVPRPIALVSTRSPNGAINVAPFSFFAGVSSEPMSLLFCPANHRDGSMKDSLRNTLPADHADLDPSARASAAQGQFVVNIVSETISRNMAACSEDIPFGDSELDISGLTAATSRRIMPPRIAESPVSFECVTLSVTRLAPGIPAGGNIVVGRVVHIHVADHLINDRLHINPAALDAIGRMGGLSYCTTRDRFDLPPTRAALNLPPHVSPRST